MKVCYFGTYSQGEGYPRNTVIIEGLKRIGVGVEECHVNFWSSTQEKVSTAKDGFFKISYLWRLLKAYIKLLIKFSKIGQYDAIIIGYLGQFDIFIAKILNYFRGSKPIILNAFISLYDTAINDREIIPHDSLKAKFLFIIDRYACLVSDRVMLDTNNHIDFFVNKFNLNRDKFFRVFVGEDDKIFYPSTMGKKHNDKLTLLHFGTVLKFHGANYIIQAAKILEKYENIQFIIIGPGSTGEDLKLIIKTLNLKNIELITDWVNYKDLTTYIASADIGLGSFGTIDKAKRVIPHKVIDFLAMAKPLITGDTPGAKEVLIHKFNAILCEIGNPSAIAESILFLNNNPELQKQIAQNGYELYKNLFTPEAIGRSVAEYIENDFKVLSTT